MWGAMLHEALTDTPVSSLAASPELLILHYLHEMDSQLKGPSSNLGRIRGVIPIEVNLEGWSTSSSAGDHHLKSQADRYISSSMVHCNQRRVNWKYTCPSEVNWSLLEHPKAQS